MTPEASAGLPPARPRARRPRQPPGPSRRGGGASGYRGVYATPWGTWQAKLRVGGRLVQCGCHRCPTAAALAHDREARRLLGPAARLNFPGKGEWA